MMSNKKKKKDPLEGYGWESGEAFLKDAKQRLKSNLSRLKMDAKITYSKLKKGAPTPADKIRNYNKKEIERKSKINSPNVKVTKNVKSRGKTTTQNREYHNNTYKETYKIYFLTKLQEVLIL